MRALTVMHPLCCFSYLLSVLCITFFTREPILLLISAAGAVALLALSGKARTLLWFPVVVAVCAALNPVFSHRGDTVLFFVGDLAITLESIMYGAVFGLMLAAAFGWSMAAVKYMTSDKYIWLFGRIAPLCGLVLSCALRLIPLFIRRTKDFTASDGSGTFKGSLKAFSAAVGYSAEEAMSSADSMRARGYGTARRTSYSLYRFGTGEALQLAAVLALSATVIALMLCGSSYEFYPKMSELDFSAHDILLYAAFGLLCLLPSLAIAHENIVRSRIGKAAKEH